MPSLEGLDRHRWTGHGVLIGRFSNDWQSTEEVLEQFGRRKKASIKAYRTFLEDGIRHGIHDLSGGGLRRSSGGWSDAPQDEPRNNRVGDERILGDGDFVERALQEDELQWSAKSRLRVKGWDLEKLIQTLCKQYDVEPNQLKERSRLNNLAVVKSLICYWSTEYFGATGASIAKRLGMSQPAVTQSSKRGKEYCEANQLDFAKKLGIANLLT